MSQESFFVLTNAPKSIDFGINCMCYETGPRFNGISLIPTGLHFIYHSTGMGARMGFFIEIDRNEIIAREFDASTEEILPHSTFSTETIDNLRRSIQLGELNDNLGPYPMNQHAIWTNLTNLITASVLALANCPLNVNIHPGDAEDMKHLPKDAMTPYFDNAPRVARFSDLVGIERHLLEQARGDVQATTALCMDKSAVVSRLIETYFSADWRQLLGELQLSFILFIMLYSYPALQHWKCLVDALCRCDALLLCTPQLFTAFIRIFVQQLSFCPVDFFEAELSKDNFLAATMACFFENLEAAELPTALAEHKRRLHVFLKKKFNIFDRGAATVVSRDGTVRHAGEFDLLEEDLPLVAEEAVGAEDVPMETAEEADREFRRRVASMSSAIDAATAQYNRSVAQFDSADIAHVEYVGAYSPVSIAVEERSEPMAVTMTAVEIENALYSWRYPCLFDEMVRTQGREDLSMTAARLFEEEALGGTRTASKAFMEARMFLEEELPRRVALSPS